MSIPPPLRCVIMVGSLESPQFYFYGTEQTYKNRLYPFHGLHPVNRRPVWVFHLNNDQNTLTQYYTAQDLYIDEFPDLLTRSHAEPPVIALQQDVFPIGSGSHHQISPLNQTASPHQQSFQGQFTPGQIPQFVQTPSGHMILSHQPPQSHQTPPGALQSSPQQYYTPMNQQPLQPHPVYPGPCGTMVYSPQAPNLYFMPRKPQNIQSYFPTQFSPISYHQQHGVTQSEHGFTTPQPHNVSQSQPTGASIYFTPNQIPARLSSAPEIQQQPQRTPQQGVPQTFEEKPMVENIPIPETNDVSLHQDQHQAQIMPPPPPPQVTTTPQSHVFKTPQKKPAPMKESSKARKTSEESLTSAEPKPGPSRCHPMPDAQAKGKRKVSDTSFSPQQNESKAAMMSTPESRKQYFEKIHGSDDSLDLEGVLSESFLLDFSNMSVETKNILKDIETMPVVPYATGIRCNLKDSKSITFSSKILDLPQLLQTVKFFQTLSIELRSFLQNKPYEKLDDGINKKMNEAEKFVFTSNEPEKIEKYCLVIESALRDRVQITVILRNLKENSTLKRYFELDTSDEICLLLLKNFILHEEEVAQDLLLKTKQNGLDQIDIAQPNEDWFSQTGSSFYLKFHNYVSCPDISKIANTLLPEAITISAFVQDLSAALLGQLTSPEQIQELLTNYNTIDPIYLSELLSATCLILAKNPDVIEKFVAHQSFSTFRINTVFVSNTAMSQKLGDFLQLPQEALTRFTEHMEGVRKFYSRLKVDLSKIPAVELAGINVMLKANLFVLEVLTLPSLEDYEELIKKLFPVAELAPIANFLCVTLLKELNQAYWKAKIDEYASIGVYRMVLEKTTDQLVYLLHKDVHNQLYNIHPQMEDANTRLLKFNKKTEKKRTYRVGVGGDDKTKTSRQFWRLYIDSIKNRQLILLLWEYNNKIYYLMRTIFNEPVELFPIAEPDPFRNFNLQRDSANLKKTIKQVVDVYHAKNPNDRITVVQIGTETVCGGVLMLSLIDFSSHVGTKSLLTLPVRIPMFYQHDLRKSNPQKFLEEECWRAVLDNQGFFAYHLANLMEKPVSEQKKIHFIELDFLTPDRNLPAEVLCIYLTVAIARTRVSFTRILRSPTHAHVLRFLLHCTSNKMDKIMAAVNKSSVLNKTQRDELITGSDKTKILRLIGLEVEEIETFGTFFFWDENGVEDDYEIAKLGFNAYMSEQRKKELWTHLADTSPIFKGNDEMKTMSKFLFSTFNVSKQDKIHGSDFDHRIFTIFKDPSKFMYDPDDYAQFGTVSWDDFHQNVTIFHFKNHLVMKFSIAHLHSKLFLDPLLLVYPDEDIHETLSQYLEAFGRMRDTPELIASAQAHLMLILNKHLNYSLEQTIDAEASTNPLWKKSINSFILNIDSPHPDWKFDTSTCILQQTYVDVISKVGRTAGRPVKTIATVTKSHNNVIPESMKTACKNFNTEFLKFKRAKDMNRQLRQVVNYLPKFDNVFKLIYPSIRILHWPIYRLGGFPYHFDKDCRAILEHE